MPISSGLSKFSGRAPLISVRSDPRSASARTHSADRCRRGETIKTAQNQREITAKFARKTSREKYLYCIFSNIEMIKKLTYPAGAPLRVGGRRRQVSCNFVCAGECSRRKRYDYTNMIVAGTLFIIPLIQATNVRSRRVARPALAGWPIFLRPAFGLAAGVFFRLAGAAR